MKDINKVIEILVSHNVTKSEYAKAIGTSRQNVNNWTNNIDGIPKRFLFPTVVFLNSLVDEKFTSCEYLLQHNDTK